AEDGVAHVEWLEHRELFEPVEGGVAVSEHVGTLYAARHCVATFGQAVRRVERLTVFDQPWGVSHGKDRNVVVGERLPDAHVRPGHHVSGFDVPRPRRSGED